jgi:hypothetical protein
MFIVCRFVPAMALVLAGCAGGMIPGKIYSDSGKVLDFEIEKSSGTGRVTARDNITGEQFAGEYVGIRETISASSSGVATAGTRMATGFGSSSVSSNMANATAFLTGDKGSSLNCQMTIQAGFSPHGIGDCSDKNGAKYHVQF